MKKIKKVTSSLLKVAMLGVLLFNVSCSKEAEVEGVAEKFLTHLNNFEFKEAKEYSDDKTASMLGMLEGFSSMAGNMPKEEKATFKITGSEIKDDVATVNYTQTKGGETKEEKLILKKIDGKWKVSMNKEDANKEDGKVPSTEKMEDSISVDAKAVEMDSVN
jgi:ribosomal protein L33